MTLYLLDTHAIVWQELADPKLSPAAAGVFAEAEAGNARLILHPIVLAELYFLLKKAGRDSIFLPLVRKAMANPAYVYEPLTVGDVLRLGDFAEISEMHDRLIAIVADRLGATIVTRDPSIRSSPKARCLW